jgi:hypothetical protein
MAASDRFQFVAAGGVALAVGLALTGCGGGMGSLSPGGVTAVSTPNPGVFPPNAVPYGRTYGEWGDEWWKWFLSIPKADNPVLDETGAKAGVGQQGPVWFLAGTIGTEVERTCTVPADKAFLFPLWNGCYWIPTDGDTPEIIRSACVNSIDHTTELECSLDGGALQGLFSYRFHSPDFFNFTGPADEADTIFPGQTGTHLSYADGFWIMLEPLAPGQHTLWFHAKGVYPAAYPSTQVFEVTVTYHLTVQ